MQLISLDTLKQISGYKTRRGVQSWLAQMNLRLMCIGKNYAVDRTSFEREFSRRHRISLKKKKYTPTQETEIAFLEELNSLLSNK